MKTKMWFMVIWLSLCLGMAGCQESSVAEETSTENAQSETEAPAESGEADRGETGVSAEQTLGEEETGEPTEAVTEEAETEMGTESEAEKAVEPSTEVPTTAEETEAETEPSHSEETVLIGDDIVQRFEWGSTVLVDLDGDGEDEKLTAVIKEYVLNWGVEKYYSYAPVILINEHSYDRSIIPELYMDYPEPNYFYLIDLDVTDTWVEIAVFDYGPSGDPLTSFLRYCDGELICIGKIPDGPPLKKDGTSDYTVQGDGKLIGNARHNILETAWAGKTWKLTNAEAFNAVIEEEIPEYYEFSLYRTKDEWLEVIKEFPIYTEKVMDTDQIINLPVGTKIEFVRHYPDGEWLEIIYGEEEMTGWIRFEGEGGERVILPGRIRLWYQLNNYIIGFNNAD